MQIPEICSAPVRKMAWVWATRLQNHVREVSRSTLPRVHLNPYVTRSYNFPIRCFAENTLWSSDLGSNERLAGIPKRKEVGNGLGLAWGKGLGQVGRRVEGGMLAFVIAVVMLIT